MSAGPYAPPPAVYEPSMLGGGSHVPLVAPHLAPGEWLHGIVDLQLSDLIRRVPRRYRPRRDGLFAVLGVVFDVAGAIVEAIEEAIGGFFRILRRIFRGRGLVGGWESEAGRFAIAVLTGTKGTVEYENRHVLLVFTDRRILLALETRRTLVLLGEIPRGRLARIELRLTGLSSRADAHFADGSRAALEIRQRDAQALDLLGRGMIPPPQQH
ncbi:hypothetical protein GCM10010441_51000 [Kitasatospora paracochleata]|uniref:DUF304 domain-containing protein n=1 Tax=Kitasatospora paracochleata TaxID=58354 RepID=A0ABT1IT60_9ACTN|nr:hypothetical protein [Kitasatospora paracochleata]MCP2307796.1 hypothetical protein [Kitasatospora paracochleata]